jgi:hypothetical protein
MLSQRGQESAPFEVLVAVIIMGFVILVGLAAMQNVTIEQCKAQIQSSAVELKAVLQEVVAGNYKSLNFNPPRCFDQKSEKMSLEVLRDSRLCSNYCGGIMLDCVLFVYASKEHYYKLCLDRVSPQTTFFTDVPCENKETANPAYRLVDLKSSVLRGSYTFINKSSSVDAFPKVCAYLRMERTSSD